MKRMTHALLFAAIIAGAGSLSAADNAKSRVLILGDSISIGYTPFVQEMLKDEAIVVRPKENCQGTNHGVKSIDRWLTMEGGNWDVIHFNFGLHDLKRVDATGKNSNDPNDSHQAPPEQYERQLREIAGKLKQTGAKLIFATTTPVPAGGVKPHRDVKDPERYNEIARRIMKEHGIAIDDLYAFAEPQLDKIQLPVNVHFTKDGSRLLAEEVVKHIRAALADNAAASQENSQP